MTAQARELVHSDIKPDNPPERAARYLRSQYAMGKNQVSRDRD